MSEELQARLRALPAVDRLAAALANGGVGPTSAEATVVARAVIEERRRELLAGAAGEPDLVARARERLRPSLRRVINATGVVIHTNLGRAPLADAAAVAVAEAARGYVNVEMELAGGRRGSRDVHVRALLQDLSGAEDALVVNNGAAAVLLAVAALAGPDGSVVVSRGQLVEIGGGFRIPEVIAQAGARLVEVGTTNRTRLEDYSRALADDAVLLRVHQSNFRTLGFVEEAGVEALCGLGAPVIDDVGSGALIQDVGVLEGEPPVRASVAAGAAVVCFSGDKLVGGPQAGLLVGRAAAIEACRRHPLARALRVGRLPLAALEATLRIYRDPARALREIPVLRMLTVESAALAARAERLAASTGGTIVDSVARVGGGALPLLELRGPAVALSAELGSPDTVAAGLRAADPPIVARISDDRVLLDPRTLTDADIELIASAVASLQARAAR